jgi:hypothetical protein
MKLGRTVGLVLGTGILASLGWPCSAAAQAQGGQQPEAGKITTLIPTGSVLRAKTTLEAKKDMSVLWLDTVKTDKGGRARIRLGDGSVLNVGSQASMMVTKHDPGKQQTDIELIYGKVRADVTKINTSDGHFDVHTKVAVCGVVGTQEYVETSDIATTVIALGGGQVKVASTDPQFPGEVMLNPGETVSVILGRGAGTKRQATAAEMLQAVQETEGESSATIEPGISVAGRSFDGVITGKDLSATRSVSFSQPGLTIKTRGEITATQIPVTITVDAAVPVGTYPITIDRPQGPAVAGFAVSTASAITPSATAGPIQLPPGQNYDVTRGAKIAFDASGARSPQGTEIVAYQWSVTGTTLAGSGSAFSANTSLLQPGNYTVQLTVVNDHGTVATQQFPLVVEAGVQPAQIVSDMAAGYESLQPSAFLKNFDQERFRNYAGFAAAIEDSFRTELETMRVFQRPVNCAVLEQQDEAVCQAEFQLQFTLKSEPQVLLDSQGNPVPAGTPPPANATMGKPVLKGSEQDTIRFGRTDQGWKVSDYAAVVSCPGGGTTSGINVGSCVFALGSTTTPSFQIVNLQLFSTDLAVGGTVNGTFTVVPVGGYTGSIQFAAQGQVGNQPVTVQFSPNPSGPSANVSFTVFGPTSQPSGISGPTSFPLVIAGRDLTGLTAASATASLTLQPDFNLALTPATTSSTPQPVQQNSTLPLTVQITSGSPFNGAVLIDFPNLPAGFTANSGTVTVGSQASFPIAISAAAAPGPALITVRGTLSSGAVKTATLFLNVISDFTLGVTPPSSQANPIQGSNLAPLQLNVQVVPTSGFAATVAIDFPNLPDNLTATGGNVAAGATGTFTINTSQIQPNPPTVVTITVRGRFGNDVQTILVFAELAFATPIKKGPTVTTSTQANVYGMEPAQLRPGDAVIARLYGSGLNSVTSVDIGGSGIKAELVDAQPTELHVRFTVDPSLDTGSRVVTLRSNGNKAATVTVDVAQARGVVRAPILAQRKTAAESSEAPEIALAQRVVGPVAPNDPQAARDGVTAAAKASTTFALRQKGELRVTLNGCTGLRLGSGSEQSCGGSADLEVSSRGGASLVIEADGVRNLGAMPLDQAGDVATEGMAEAAPLQAGSTYLVKTRHGVALVRLVQARGIESLRNAPPAALRAPRVGGTDRGGPAAAGGSSEPMVTLVLEWKTLQQ